MAMPTQYGSYKSLGPRAKAAAAGLTLVTASLLGGISQLESSGKIYHYPYKDIVGIWTVCDGITGKHVIPGKFYSDQECKDLNSGAIEAHGLGLLACTEVPITQPQYEGLTSWTYNIGIGAACKSTLVRMVNAGKPAKDFCQQLHVWTMAGGKREQGLVNRRWAEYKVCTS